ncbi:aconitase X catalytic domain-containing protein [Arthrobacter sp. 35W]|uniref:aconitase X catalytic domain-containing protein n=1 Tax=Arthrobacter sp. 35W TaxID=1132441 RepID=UPI00041F62D5|nr:aconitase X catalytic domain-containing protein [Arthrobacter sp. 35W]
MHLTDEEQDILARGDALADAFREQIQVGEFFGAERMVPVSNAHFMGDPEVFGDAGAAYLARLTAAGLRTAIPTSRNATCVDLEHLESFQQSKELAQGEIGVRKQLTALGVMAVNTCIGYQTLYQPRLGEHVAWGDTGTVAYANSVLGARTNYESGTASLLAGMTGRTPAYGFHLDENRKANAIVRVAATMGDLAHWGALGAVAGTRYRGYDNVVAFVLPDGVIPSSDALKHLAAAIASYGSMAMFHIVGQTPEASTLDMARGERGLLGEGEFSQADLEEFMGSYSPDDLAPDVVVFTAPQLSMFEIQDLALKLEGRKIREGTKMIITTNRSVYVEAERTGLLQTITGSGASILQDTCWYLMDPAQQRKSFGWNTLATNSAKLANIVKAHGYTPTVLTTAECILASTVALVASGAVSTQKGN